jgi:hypothetical protein
MSLAAMPPIDPERFEKLEKNVDRLVAAMLGDSAMGTQGLVGQFGELRDTVRDQGERLATVEGERTLEADDREWVKGVRLNWSSPARLIVGGIVIAVTAGIGALVTKWLG